MAKQITDMETWLLDNSERIFKFVVYKKIYTPYEVKNAFIDETEFEDGGYYKHGKIEEAIDLGNGDWLFGFRLYDLDYEKEFDNIEYFKLSEIRLSYNFKKFEVDDA